MSSQVQDESESQRAARMYSDPKFFFPTLSSIPEPMSQVLEAYSGIPRSQQIEHVLRVRGKAWDSKAYPCLGRFRFLDLDLSTFPLYNEYVLPRLKQRTGSSKDQPILLDLGTCLGQDLRKLIYDGVSPSQLYGSDVEMEFIKSGYELFNDTDKIPKDHFICPADLFDTSDDDNLRVLDDRVDILHVSAVFHLFDLEHQRQTARRCLRLLRKDAQNKSLMLGGQVGNINPSDAMRTNNERRYRHNEASWKKMWDEVCAEPEWRNKVKNIEVNVALTERYKEDGTSKEEKQKMIGSAEEGFRWMVWSVFVEFQ